MSHSGSNAHRTVRVVLQKERESCGYNKWKRLAIKDKRITLEVTYRIDSTGLVFRTHGFKRCQANDGAMKRHTTINTTKINSFNTNKLWRNQFSNIQLKSEATLRLTLLAERCHWAAVVAVSSSRTGRRPGCCRGCPSHWFCLDHSRFPSGSEPHGCSMIYNTGDTKKNQMWVQMCVCVWWKKAV